jgi:hypothetical protein
LDPLKDMNDVRAETFLSVIGARFPYGAETLRRMDSDFILLNELLGKPRKLDKLIAEPTDKKDAARQDAYQKIQTLVLSPVLRSVLCKATNFSLDGIVLLRLDRATLGDQVAFALANFFIMQYRQLVVITDGNFYLRDHHISLIRQDRLVVGVRKLSRLSDSLRDELLSMPERIASRALYRDAIMLAEEAGLRPDPSREDNPYNRFIDAAMADHAAA